MAASETYQLLDFGEGRKLEQFGPLRLDRPCPGTEGVPRANPDLWPPADARFVGASANAGRWESAQALAERWTVGFGPCRFELKRSQSGHVGVFPEQAATWPWLAEAVGHVVGWDSVATEAGSGGRSGRSPNLGKRGTLETCPTVRVLNLFAYTGGSTLACATAGAEVTHVDAARNVVAWARRNAGLSGLGERPIRWIAEDALKFARREAKRGSRYDAVILDPPSYGHGPHGEVWRLSRGLPRLLTLCAELTAGQCRFLLLTCHTPGYDPPRLEAMVREAFDECSEGRFVSETMTLPTPAGRALPSGVAVRWEQTPAGSSGRQRTQTVNEGRGIPRAWSVES